MANVREMELAHFSGRVGQTFGVPVRGQRLQLVLGAAQPIPGSVRAGGGFRLEFVGPHDPQLAQGIFPFEIGRDRFEIFVTPIGSDAKGVRYEAVFF